MDKNFFIAILLTVLIIIVYTSPQYQKRFGKALPHAPQVETSPTDSLQTTVPPRQTAVLPRQTPTALNTQNVQAPVQEKTVQDSAFAQINAPDHDETVVLNNEDITVELSSRAGAVIQANMNKYIGLNKDEKVRLVTEGQQFCTGIIRDNDVVIDLSNILFTITAHTEKRVTFTAELTNGKRIVKEYSIDATGYMLHTVTTLDGQWSDPELSFSWLGPLNNTEEPTRQIRIWPFTMFMRDDTTLYDKISYLGQGDRVLTEEGKKTKTIRAYSKEGAQKLEIKKDKPVYDTFKGDLDWYAIRNKYFMTAAIPKDTKRWQAESSGFLVDGSKWFNFTISKPTSAGNTALDIYFGPISFDTLKSYNSNLTEIMELSWRFIRPISIAFLWTIKKMFKVIPNWGIVIIVFSVLIKIVLYPLSKSSLTSMKKMSSLQPQINELKEKYKNPQKQHLEMMALYKKEGINPLGGCLPMLLQLPVFFALYPVVGRAFELRQAMFIPHWIEDLSRPDPFYILPVAMGISMYFQSKETMKDPNQKPMLYIMPVMMVILFANFSSGLTLYWFMFNILTSLQQKFVKL